ncbi:MAG: hypothetical protein IBX61_07295 [Thermoleophilia bacterium]|nr:hypothetical protein [Thermoleophilia bacterium]
MSRIAIVFFLMSLILSFAACGDSEDTPSDSGLAKQTREAGEVSVSVIPQELGEDESSWNFEVVLNTHTVELVQDPAQVSVLVADGQEYLPLAWEGDPPGGHHREGTLKFPPVSPRPDSLQLIIREFGGVERSFGWTLE